MTRRSSGALIYNDDKRNHVIWPGRKRELEKFVLRAVVYAHPRD